jgi:hypothetical protein
LSNLWVSLQKKILLSFNQQIWTLNLKQKKLWNFGKRNTNRQTNRKFTLGTTGSRFGSAKYDALGSIAHAKCLKKLAC